eukprot:gnl/TRDRNA2_/TRDRNA2_168095_c0_seq1.p1 gnl/TRDRNA2_/TRDRNA2_168095_c0~~gnl/TRDRNA2_/TRDRNA2_168095_c0_seq1.p1  ORF type:complete len:658 (-),score=120.45 gnl/TRDRNA2_/TRDRNA2_168095_c0_seq1:116-1906(-)
MCAEKLGFQLSQIEMIEIFNKIDQDADGYISSDEFLSHLRGGRHKILLYSLLHVFRMHQVNTKYSLPPSYNFDRPTNCPENNYGSSERKFYGPFKGVRERLDFSHHGSYSEKRQAWQDTVVSSMTMRSEPQPMPWLIYTCGGYGTGKGFSIAWMSDKCFFPLTDMVCIDPDDFKRVMPEWKEYLHRGKDAGSMCHAESVYMQEIVQSVAMKNRQSIWIDGSLSNTEWFKGLFQDFKERYPYYRIAIFYIYASEERARARIEARRKATGRSIPEEKIAKSLQGAKSSVLELTPYVDFVARIENNGPAPILRATEVVDRSGSWDAIARRFAQRQPRAKDFPGAMAPLNLRPLEEEAVSALEFQPDCRQLRLDLAALHRTSALPARESEYLKAHLPESLVLDTSTVTPVPADREMRRLAAVPANGATDFCFIYNVQTRNEDDPLRTSMFIKDSSYNTREGFSACVELLKYGGFAYLNEDGAVVAVRTISKRPGIGMLQFGPRRPLPEQTHTAMNDMRRWHPVNLGRLQAAIKFAWIAPGEQLAGEQLGGMHGAVTFILEDDGDAWLYPVASATTQELSAAGTGLERQRRVREPHRAPPA